MLLNTAYGYLYAFVMKKKKKKKKEETLISDDISNSGRTTVPFFRTPWVNPGQLSNPSSIPFSPLSPFLPTCVRQKVQYKRNSQLGNPIPIPYLLVQQRDFLRYGNEYKMSRRYLLASLRAQ